MAHTFGSAEWAAALHDEINQSSEYRNAASGWGHGFNGNVLLDFLPDGELANGRHLLIRLAAGTCEGVEFVDSGCHPEAGFTLRAPYLLWKDILSRKTLAATAILTGALKVDGDKMKLLKHTAANRTLIHCAASVDTSW